MTRKQIEPANLRWKLPASLPEFSRPANSPVKSPAPARLVVAMRCTVTDRDFSISFRASALKSGVYFVERVTAAAADGRPESSGAGERALQIPIHQLPFGDVKCPCGHDVGPIRCGVCRQLVCTGRVRGDFFRCCDSCGASGRFGGGSLTHVTGHEGQNNLRLAKTSAPQLAAPNVKLIGKARQC